MGNCITSTIYTMKADIYSASVTQDAVGAVQKTWQYEKTINCYARGVIRKGVGDNSVVLNVNQYINVLNSLVKLKSAEVISSDKRVVLIRNNEEVIYKEDQDPSSEGGFESSTIFEPRGSTPITNFDGSVVEYETVLMRQEVQRLDV